MGSTQRLPSVLAEELKLDFDYQDIYDSSIDDSQSMKLVMYQATIVLSIVILGLVDTDSNPIYIISIRVL